MKSTRAWTPRGLRRQALSTAAAVLIASAIVALPVPGAAAELPPGGTFTDDDGSVHEGYIEAIAAAGITHGCNPPANDRYCPTSPVTRGQMAAFVARALRLPPTNHDFFTDDNDSIFEDDINRVAAAGITRGCNPPTRDRYCPGRNITRGQMAAFIVRALGLDDRGRGDYFVDDDDSVFEPDIDRLRAAGITSGCNPPDNTRFCPSARLVRAQMASFLGKALQLQPRTPPARPVSFDVEVRPGDDVQQLLSSHGEGTVFYLRAGVYKRVTLKPRSNQKIIGEPGAILDGEGVTADGIGSAAANGIVIKGLEIRNYTDKCVEWGAQGYGRNWRIENNDIHHCAVGIKVKSDNTYVGNTIHHNRIYGISGSGDNIKVIGNEISYNRTDTSAAYGDSGATKFASTTNLVLRDNYVHHNYGHGLWTDGHTKNALIEDNRVVANHGNGIFHELGYGPTIRNNWVEGNGTGQSGRGADGAGISVFSTFDAVVSGNTVKNNVHGIVGKHDERCCQRSGTQWQLKNLRVTGNTVTMDEGYTGLYDLASGDDVYSSSWNNVFADNTYTLQPSSGTFFLWKDPDPGTATHERLTLTQWRKVQTGDR